MNLFEQNAIDALAQFVKLAGVRITKNTLSGALLRHRNFPSLSSLQDVLTDCQIQSKAGLGSIENLAAMSLPAIAFLKINGGIFAPIRKVTLEYVEWYHTQKGWQKDNLYEFEKKWTGAILLLKSSGGANEKNFKFERTKELVSKSVFPTIVFGILIAIAILVKNGHNVFMGIVILLVLKLLGVGASIFLMKQSYGFLPHPVLRSEVVLQQDRNKIRNFQALKPHGRELQINWPEIGFIYFGTGILLIFGELLLSVNTHSLLFALNILILPVTGYLVYYQFVNLKVWCAWCIATLLIFWLEFTTIIWLRDDFYFSGIFNFYFTLPYVLFVAALCAVINPLIRRVMTHFDLVRQVRNMKFNKAYVEGWFKRKNDMPPIFENMKVIGIGDPSAKHVITVVFSPSTWESSKAHVALKELQSRDVDFYWQIVFLPISRRDVDVAEALLSCPSETVCENLDSWFANIDQPVSKWKGLQDHKPLLSEEEVKDQITMHVNWCSLAKIVKIPSLFINGASIPSIYQVEDLPFLINCQSTEGTNTEIGATEYLGDSGITVILNVWKRDHVNEQLVALFNQTTKPSEIWILQCGDFVELNEVKRKYPFVKCLSSSVNLKYFGRFSFAQYVRTPYIYMLDDDIIPARGWMELCKNICEKEKAIVSSAGRIIPRDDYYPERLTNIPDSFVGDCNHELVYNFCKADTVVDFGCNSWFFKTEWLSYFWKITPHSLETGEDIHLSASCCIAAAIPTIVPTQVDTVENGNLKKWYGQDHFASWKHHDFLLKRADIIKNMIQNESWRPISWR